MTAVEERGRRPRKGAEHPTSTSDRHAATALLLGALGVVYGDIGTSPLYALRESFAAHNAVVVSPANVLGVLSLITWSLIIVISIKYLVFVMRADHEGEGGILALTGLVPRSGDYHGRGKRRALVLVGVFGTALLYGDGMITPAISVLSAVEGLEILTDTLDPVVVPLSCIILVGLFTFQSRGTRAVGAVFGPVMLVWFSTLAVLGVGAIVRAPQVLAALNPIHGLGFFVDNGFAGFLALGSVFLVVTGGEALYADMGHFGRRPIRDAWFALVLPALLCNYYGQGALLLGDPSAVTNPFFRLAPTWAVVPLIVLSTLATVIASQALISGVFSLTAQAMQVEYLPRMQVVHTSESQIGQIYLPAINWALMAACIGLVVGFGSSAALAGAYGVAVTMTMVVTTLLFGVVARERFGWPGGRVALLTGAFLLVDLGFFGANVFKIPDGGWFPLVVGVVVYTAMTTWRRGRHLLGLRLRKGEIALDAFLRDLGEEARVPGTAVYLTKVAGSIPIALLANLRHNNALHEAVLLVHVDMLTVPHVPPARQAVLRQREHGFVDVVLRYGFRDQMDVPATLRARVAPRVRCDFDDITYIIGRERTVGGGHYRRLPRWRAKLFALMTRNAADVAQFFRLPGDRIVEIGVQVQL